jgi:hydrogenase/urease accessory protein HupE
MTGVSRLSQSGNSYSIDSNEREGHLMEALSIAILYIQLGVEHILGGLDHLVFLVALLLIASTFIDVLKIVTAFTVAHSLTLTMAVTGLIPVYESWIEAGIALTICYVAIENIVQKTSKWRWLVTFFFGLIHGIGFSSAIGEIGMSQTHFALSLLTFNIGIELGQLVIVGVLWFVLSKARSNSWYRNAVVRTGSVCIFLVGLYWFIERVWGV